ncbi:CLUMA_CG014956, isoform A [Clunio marinus]|uniref:CLUMA_CG014956, isoform A n=1 Tax=Clunio marinus TaxID=568069 RepID=A0A1J1IQC2_9DIPT|nr:CLUMA_CG014956, isoform A [Clunio marinus]
MISTDLITSINITIHGLHIGMKGRQASNGRKIQNNKTILFYIQSRTFLAMVIDSGIHSMTRSNYEWMNNNLTMILEIDDVAPSFESPLALKYLKIFLNVL